ncbi:MAG: rane protein of unknown function [Nitrospira sp.]|nr:rane protein of unknown function [Nitrospira sp.]
MLRDKAAVITLAIFLCGYAVLWVTGITSTGHLLDNVIAGYLLAWGLYGFLSDLPRQEIRARFVLMTLVGVALLGAAELLGAVGWINYQTLLGTQGRTWFERPGYVRDPELGYRHEAHYRERGSFVRGNIGEALCLPANPPVEFDLRYDQHGFRNDEDRDQADVVVIGDSYVESPMLPNSSLLTTGLSRSLGAPVVNMGISGYGPEQELVVLKRYALTLRPKTIVWLFFEGNDLLQLDPEDESARREPTITALEDSYWMRSLTRNLLVLSKKVAKGCVPHQTYLQFRGIFQEATGKQTEMFFWEKPAPLRPMDRLRLERLRSILKEAHELCRRQGVHLVVAFAPVSYRVHQGLENFEPSTPQMRAWQVNDLPDQVKSLLGGISQDIVFVDMTQPLRTAAAAGVLTYLPDDTHWTTEGQRVAGQALHQQVLASINRSAERMGVSSRGFSEAGWRRGLQRL